MSAFAATLARELTLAARNKLQWLMPPLFYVIVVTLFGLGAKANDPLLTAFAPAVLWVGALLSALLSLEVLFRADFEDGTLEHWFLADSALAIVYAKLAAHWLLSGLPLVLLAAPLAGALALPGAGLPVLLAGLALGTPVLSLVGGFAAALTVGLPRGGALLPVLVLPLITPVVIFGAGAVRAAQSGLPVDAPLYFLAAIFVLSLTVIPWASTAALRNSYE
ncbi:MAG TPA: heme exporter protein CcmB [Nevskiaceae bacterium]|nr:heme exporter protein CcmB [Nevskiaceae bacterium]